DRQRLSDLHRPQGRVEGPDRSSSESSHNRPAAVQYGGEAPRSRPDRAWEADRLLGRTRGTHCHPEEAGAKRSATEEPALRSASDVGIAFAPRQESLAWTAILLRFAPQDDARGL